MHRYLSREAGALCDNVVMLVRQMRHYGLRVFVSTQSPEVGVAVVVAVVMVVAVKLV